MRYNLDRFGDTAIAVITFSPPAELPAHRHHLALPFPLLADPSRLIYRCFELGRGALHRIWDQAPSASTPNSYVRADASNDPPATPANWAATS